VHRARRHRSPSNGAKQGVSRYAPLHATSVDQRLHAAITAYWSAPSTLAPVSLATRLTARDFACRFSERRPIATPSEPTQSSTEAQPNRRRVGSQRRSTRRSDCFYARPMRPTVERTRRQPRSNRERPRDGSSECLEVTYRSSTSPGLHRSPTQITSMLSTPCDDNERRARFKPPAAPPTSGVP
jgi:hypothetical protein